MPQPHSFDPAIPPVGQRRCLKCGLPMFLSHIEPADQPNHDLRIFECTICGYSVTVTVKFR
jgi:hypothetical protein